MGFEIPIDVDYFEHPKTLHLCSILRNPLAFGYPLKLWGWAARYARDGVVKCSPEALEVFLGWRGTPRALHQALISAGWLEIDGVTIHDWKHHIGRSIAIYERKKQKQREKYDKEKGILPEESRQDSPNPGGETQDTLDRKLGRGSEKPPPPPVSAEPTDQEIIEAVHRRDVTFPVREIQGQITRAVRIGVSKATLLNDINTMGDRMTIWAIVDLYQYPKGNRKNGAHQTRENATAYLKERPPVLQERSEDVLKRQDDARAKCRELLLGMDAGVRDDWMREAKAQAQKERVPAPVLTSFVESKLLSRVAKEHGIEGI